MVTFDKAKQRELEQFDSDTLLMLQLRDGDDGAFDQLYDRFFVRVKKLIDHFLSNRRWSEDLAQEVFLRVYRARASYQPKAKFSTWLYTITRNVAFKTRESESRRAVLYAQIPADTAECFERESRESDPSTSLEIDELRDLLQTATDRLSKRQRKVVSLYYLEHKNYADIASELRTSAFAIKSLLHRARTNLRENLIGQDESLAVCN